MRICHNCILLLVASLLSVHAIAGNGLHFRTVSPRGGFYYDGVTDIEQDSENFIWVMLENELLRYDGYEYRNYSEQFKAGENESPNWSFVSMESDSDGNLYVATSTALFIYDNSEDSFKILKRGYFSLLCRFGSDGLSCVHKGHLCHISSDNAEPVPFICEGKMISSIRFTISGDSGAFCSTTSGKVLHLTSNESGYSAEPLPDFKENLALAGLSCYKDCIYALTEDLKVIKYNFRLHQEEGTSKIGDIADNVPVKSFTIDSRGVMWIGTLHGLYVVNPLTGESQLYKHSNADPFSIPNNSVWIIFEDNLGIIWLGHYAGGLSFVDVEENLQVSSYRPDLTALSENLVSCFAEYGTTLFVGTEGGGINILDKDSNSFSWLKHNNVSNSLSHNNVKSLLVDEYGDLWIAMFRGGLDRYDLTSGTFRHYRHDKRDSLSLLGDELRKIVAEKNVGLWIAYQLPRAEISYMPFDEDQISHFRLGPDEFVYDICKDNRSSMLWVLTRTRLYSLNTFDGTVSENYLPGLRGQSLCIDDAGDVWIGTFGNGLVKFNPKNASFTHLDDLSHWGVTAVFSICHDKSGSLWLGTDNGLLQYNISKGTMQKYDESDGFQGQVYYPLASMVGTDGKLYFGGTNGFSVLHSPRSEGTFRKPVARISRFYIDNTASNFYNLGGSGNTVRLDWDQDNFGFVISSDSYVSPGKNHFRYRLKGYNDNWTIVNSAGRQINYSKIPAGHYSFEVQTANSDDVWGDPTVIHITRRSAPWASWPAYLLYGLIAAFSAVAIVLRFRERMRLKLQMNKESLARQKNEELHAAQLRFFTNVSHDFRTPLSLILYAEENIIQGINLPENHNVLRNNANRLLRLVNELMDFRQIENRSMRLNVSETGINGFISGIAADFIEYGKKRNINFSIQCDETLEDNLLFDGYVIEKVVMNLLNNAFRYTADGGEICIKTISDGTQYCPAYKNLYSTGSGENPKGKCAIIVSDTGVGISGESISSVFERYYSVDTVNPGCHLGTGIGLAIVKGLVELHKGWIDVCSERGKGTGFIVYLPYDNSAYTEEEKSLSSSVQDIEMFTCTNAFDRQDLIAENGENCQDEPGRKTVLVVEDNHDMCILLASFLSLHYNVRIAPDGASALTVIEKESIDLVLSDIMMPVMDGITLCKEIRNNLGTSHIPVILLTAKSGDEARIEGADCGADLFFTKPVNLKLLLQSISNVFSHRQNLYDYYSKNFWVDSSMISTSSQDSMFLNKLIEVIDRNLCEATLDVNMIASELCMSRTKLFQKLKSLTGKNIVEFTLNQRMRKAANLIMEGKTVNEVTELVGLHSRSYFDKVFKKEFGVTPAKFISNATSEKKQQDSFCES